MRITRFVGKKNRGFTLIELMLFMAMFSIILVVLTNLFSAIVEKQLETESISAVENDSKFITSRLMYDITRSDSITTPAALGDQTTNLSVVIGGVTYIYGLSGGNLTLTQGAQTDNLNSNRTTISGISFTRLGKSGGKHVIQVSFTVTSNTLIPNGPETKAVTIVIGTR